MFGQYVDVEQVGRDGGVRALGAVVEASVPLPLVCRQKLLMLALNMEGEVALVAANNVALDTPEFVPFFLRRRRLWRFSSWRRFI